MMNGVKGWNKVKRVLGYCPYCIVGKQVADKVSSKKTAEKKSESVDNSEKRLIERMRTGRNVALIGVFCPIFWVSLFMGASGSVLLLNAIHSSIFIGIGITYSLINFIILRKLRLIKVK